MAISKKKKIMAIILASATSISAAAVSSFVITYDAIFPRLNRPDYAITAGQYCIERIPGLVRKEIWVQSQDNRLKAYVYDATNPKGLVVVAHGMKAGADELLPIIKYLVDSGFSVVAHNVTGTYESEGDSTVGMCQSLIDMDSVIGFIQASPVYKNMPLFTLGHSWGGYAASSVLAIKQGISACALIAPMRNPTSMIFEKGEQYVGKIAKLPKPVLLGYHKVLFGKYTEYDAIKGINATNVPVLVAHGVDDNVITYDVQSVLAHRNEITNPNVKYVVTKGIQGGHTSVWHSVQSELYQMEVASTLKQMEFDKGEPLTYEEKVAFFQTVDHELYSQVNHDLMQQIVDMFTSALPKHLPQGN